MFSDAIQFAEYVLQACACLFVAGGLLFLGFILYWISTGKKHYEEDRRKAVATLAKSQCRHCGAVYGEQYAAEASKKAELAIAEAMAEGLKEGLRVNPSRAWEIVCPACRYVDFFDYEAHCFEDHCSPDPPDDAS